MHKTLLLFIALFCFLGANAQRFNEHYYRAQAAVDNGNLNRALVYIDSSTVSMPRNPLVWLKKGEIYFRLNTYDKAIECFNTAESFRKGIAVFWLARAYAMQSDTDKALEMLEQHLSSAPKTHEATILLDTSFNSIENTVQWKEFWLNDWYTNYERFLAEVEYYNQNGDTDIAFELLNDRMQGRRPRHQLYALRGEMYLTMNSYKAAEADFKQAIKSKKRGHEYIYLRAKSLMQLKKYKKSLQLLTKAIELSGGEPRYYLLRAMAFAKSQEYPKAIDDVKHYLTFYPNNIEANKMFADYSISAGKSIDALLQLGKLIKVKPANYEYYLLRAKIYMETKKWDIASIDLNKCLELNPDNAEAYLNRGICKVNMGKNKEACSDWKIAIKKGNFKAQEYSYKYCK
ncbi:MAG: tetratricopeptide repeat protein [Bacteroidales bacterium]|nr:tetratricopeptide repeat protein [Bacteroidales bacterium]